MGEATTKRDKVAHIKLMDWKTFASEWCGYELMTTFACDFDIADAFGVNAIRNTYKKAFNEWKDNYKYLTELVLVLNWKIGQYFGLKNQECACVYNELWMAADSYAEEHLRGEELAYFHRVTD